MNEIIYSPHPPMHYTVDGRGPGEWAKGEIPEWNLAWLALPQLESDFRLVDPAIFGSVIGAIPPGVNEYIDGLRGALIGPPDKLSDYLVILTYYDPPEGLGADWLDTVYARLAALTNSQPTFQETRIPERNIVFPETQDTWGKVVHVDFRNKKTQ